jgi:acyl-CoA synthetase (AMP-forming)/AMP-acid ligase II
LDLPEQCTLPSGQAPGAEGGKPVPSTIVGSPFPAVAIPDVSLPALVLDDAAARATKPALIDGPSGRTITYGELADRVRLVAGGLAARGFQRGEVFAIYCPNLPEYAVAFYGVLLAGGTNTTINPLYTVEELSVQLNDAGAGYLLTVPPFLDKAVEAAGRSGVREVFVLGEAAGAIPFAELLRAGRQPPGVIIGPHDLAVLAYSSGTTGLPKGVVLTHHNLVATLCQCRPVVDVREDDVGIAVLPFFHAYGLTVLMAFTLWRGATLVTMPRFDLEQFLTILQDYRVTGAPLVPPIMLALAKHPLVDRFDLSALRSVGSGAAPLGAELQEACARRLACMVFQGYGLTESPVLTLHPAQEARIRHGSAGQLLPNTQAKVVDPATGEALGRNQDGELCFRGPQVMRGYLNRPQETAHMLGPDGWLHSGDIGHVDDDGYFYIVDRVKELIKYKGLQVAPAELEAVLVSHPAIADAAVVRAPDEEAGEVPKAFVVTKTELSAQQVIDYVAGRVAPHKKVRAVEFIDEIPRSLSGKILRRVLMERDRHAAGSPPS